MINRLENLKRDNILFFSNYEWFPDWEIFLTNSDYWKSWRAKIPTFQTEKELDFYTQRLGEIVDLIRRCKKYGVRDGEDADLLIKQEEKRLENISEEDWKKEYKFADVKLEEMSAEEINGNFGDEIDKLFGVDRKGKNNKPLNNSNSQQKPQNDEGYNSDDELSKTELNKALKNNDDYDKLTREELIKEIELLKSEIKKLKSAEVVGNFQTTKNKETSQKLEKQLQKAESSLNNLQSSNTSNSPNSNNILILSIIGGIILLLIGLVIWKKNKNNTLTVK